MDILLYVLAGFATLVGLIIIGLIIILSIAIKAYYKVEPPEISPTRAKR